MNGSKKNNNWWCKSMISRKYLSKNLFGLLDNDFANRTFKLKRKKLLRNLFFDWIWVDYILDTLYQRWSPRGRPWPRGQILKSLASRPQVLENWPVLGSRTALFFELLKLCGAVEKFFGKRFFVEIAWKIFLKTFFFFFFWDRLKNFCEDLFFFFGEHLCLCPWPWPRAFLSLASRVSVLGLGFFLVSLALSLVSSTPPLPFTNTNFYISFY